MKWKCTSMCLVQAWYWWLQVSAIVNWLLQSIVVGSLKGPNTSERRLRSQSASFTPCIAATYSLSVVDRETISCHLEDHEMAPPSMRKVYPEMAWRSSAMLSSVLV